MSSPPPRIRRLFEAEPDLDAVLLINAPPDPSFFWATGLHDGGTFEGSLALVRPDDRPIVLTSPLEETTARKSSNEIVLYEDGEDRWDKLADLLDVSESVGLDFTTVPVKRYEKLTDDLDCELVDASDAIEAARLIKDPAEVEAIEATCQLTDAIADEMETYVQDAATEAELAANIVHAILSQGAQLSFDPIVAFGPGSAEPHYSPARVELGQGTLLVDMGAKQAGYCSDITRTYSLGPPSEELEAMHQVVLEAQQVALDTIAPGVQAPEVHQAAEAVIEASDYAGRFIHSTGHSLGVEVHDGPGLSPKSDVVIEEGMVFTVEPGVYVPDEGGVRIEEDVVVTSEGCRRLTSASRELRDVRA